MRDFAPNLNSSTYLGKLRPIAAAYHPHSRRILPGIPAVSPLGECTGLSLAPLIKKKQRVFACLLPEVILQLFIISAIGCAISAPTVLKSVERCHLNLNPVAVLFSP